FTFFPLWTKPERCQVQQINDGLVTSPSMFMLQQLPISKELIIKGRYIIYFVYSFPFHLLLLISLYGLTPSLQEMIGIGSYISFCMIWVSFSIYIGGIIPVSDAGDRASPRKVVVYGVLMLIGTIAF